VIVKALSPGTGTQISLLGSSKPLTWSQRGSDVRIDLPATLPGEHAYVLKITGSGL
jgi:hypothetical protein